VGNHLALRNPSNMEKKIQEYEWETRTFEEGKKKISLIQGGGLRQIYTIEKVENPSSRFLIYKYNNYYFLLFIIKLFIIKFNNYLNIII
jgi:hypothetical protein